MASKREIAQRIKDAGKRARAEAEARRSAEKKAAPEPRSEIGGRAGPEPTRFGDWEKNGLISDF